MEPDTIEELVMLKGPGSHKLSITTSKTASWPHLNVFFFFFSVFMQDNFPYFNSLLRSEELILLELGQTWDSGPRWRSQCAISDVTTSQFSSLHLDGVRIIVEDNIDSAGQKTSSSNR